MSKERSKRIRVLFICVHNSGRSQMAEAFLNEMAGDRFRSESAGFNPTRINPMVVETMRETGIDLSGNQTRSVFKLYQGGNLYDFVITVCEESTENQCPLFPGITHKLNWPFDNPETFEGSHEEQLNQVRRVRDEIKSRIETWLQEMEDGG